MKIRPSQKKSAQFCPALAISYGVAAREWHQVPHHNWGRTLMTLAACESTFGLGLEEVEISATGLERWKTWLDEGRVAWPMEDGQVALERAAEWNSSFKPFNSFEMYLTFQAATHALRVERCQHHERALRSLQMMRAVRRWDADRRNLAEELGSRIDRQPAVVARKLASTRHGCEWLIERWEGLQLALATPEGWEEPQLTMALNLLGTPMELREVAAVAIPARRDEVVRAEIDRLRTLKAEGLDELDAFERAAAEAGIAPDDRPRAEIKRYERSCALGLQWAHGQLKKARHDYRPDGPAPGRTPAQTPSTSTSTAPAPRSESDYRDELRALAARKKAGAEAERGGAEPPEPRPILPEPVVAIPAPEAPRPIDVASPPVEAPSAPIGNPSEFLARTHEGRIQALMAGVVAMAAGRVAPPVANRRARRAQKARNRRRA